MSGYVKRRADAPPGFFEAEAAGLRWLADAHGGRVASVIDVSPTRLVVEAIEAVRPTPDAARRFGAALAVTHAAGAAAFGAPPAGYEGPLFIGRRPLPLLSGRRGAPSTRATACCPTSPWPSGPAP